MTPIGYFHCLQKFPYDVPKQPGLTANQGYIKLLSNQQFETALEGLGEFSHIWVLFLFHLNPNWKPKVSPPYPNLKKQGVFATRAPYRPNPIGMSVVKLEKIERLNLHVLDHDLLDGTPILDIKPYVKTHDSHPEASLGWLENLEQKKFQIRWSVVARAQAEWINHYAQLDLIGAIETQLSINPTDHKKKRIQKVSENRWCLSYRTWRIFFLLELETIKIVNVSSGYTPAELFSGQDKYQDKIHHKSFLMAFPREKET